MARGGLSKKRGPSIHSRAARRATSPGIDTDKSLKNVTPPSQSVDFRPAILAVHHGAGVNKKSKPGRKSVLSSKARRRQEKSIDRAEAVMEKIAKKVERGKGQVKNIQSRRKPWDEINKHIPSKTTKKSGNHAANGAEEEGGVDWHDATDDEMDGADDTTLSAPRPVPVLGGPPPIEAAQVPLPEEEEEL